jgi:hypothetical protein
MWTTEIKHQEGRVIGMTHYFDNKVRVVTDFEEMTICRYHGDVCVQEFTADPHIDHYVQYLYNVSQEL